MTTREVVEMLRGALVERYDAREVAAMTRIIMEDVVNYSPVDTVIHENDELPAFVISRLHDIGERLRCGEPLQYVLGEARFHGHRLKVTPATLIPRPETEQLVDIIVDENPSTDLRVLDIGTGSGCIAVSLARALRWAVVTATDISADALDVARENAAALNVAVTFLQEDILTAAPPHEAFDIVVSNPPYVCQSERPTLDAHVLQEPESALFVPDDDPLLYYRAIARYAATALTQGGRLYLEINSRFGNEMRTLLAAHGFSQINIITDAYGNTRFATASKS